MFTLWYGQEQGSDLRGEGGEPSMGGGGEEGEEGGGRREEGGGRREEGGGEEGRRGEGGGRREEGGGSDGAPCVCWQSTAAPRQQQQQLWFALGKIAGGSRHNNRRRRRPMGLRHFIHWQQTGIALCKCIVLTVVPYYYSEFLLGKGTEVTATAAAAATAGRHCEGFTSFIIYGSTWC